MLTIKPWIWVPNARKTLIWHFDFFHFVRTFGFFRAFGVRMGGGGYAPFPKFLGPPLLYVSTKADHSLNGGLVYLVSTGHITNVSVMRSLCQEMTQVTENGS